MNPIEQKYFFFVRHAQTDWNRQKICQGQRDIPLSLKGYQEAKTLAADSLKVSIECIVTSPLSRALETAKEIHKAKPHAKLHIIPELSERSWGSLEGMSSHEMYDIERLEENDASYFPGNGVEPRGTFNQRVLQAISIAQTFHEHPLLVSHGRVFIELCRILGIPPLRQIPNCQLVKISPRNESWEIHLI